MGRPGSLLLFQVCVCSQMGFPPLISLESHVLNSQNQLFFLLLWESFVNKKIRYKQTVFSVDTGVLFTRCKYQVMVTLQPFWHQFVDTLIDFFFHQVQASIYHGCHKYLSQEYNLEADVFPSRLLEHSNKPHNLVGRLCYLCPKPGQLCHN